MNARTKWWIPPVLAALAAAALVEVGDVHFVWAGLGVGLVTGLVFQWEARRLRKSDPEA